LFCFPHAGGGGSLFMPFARELAPTLDVRAVQLPGRENRLRERAHTRLTALIDELVGALREYLDAPFALFGHSMGALVAFELARRLRAVAMPAPVRLFVAGHRAPQLPSRHPRLGHLTDPEFIDAVGTRYGGVPEEVLRHADLMALLLPCLRADMTLIEGYVYEADDPLPCPISVYGGVDDVATTEAELEAWRVQTRADCTLTRFPGGHFFVRSARPALVSTVSRELALVDARR
jgi:medium-chain acyl-[acyl-carrier-protein] hydrolase